MFSSVRAVFFRLCAWSVLAIGIFAASCAVAGGTPIRLVVVTSADSRIGPLTRPMIRKIYLGSSAGIASQPIHPLINQSNRLLYEMFLQKVLFMSKETYERHMRHSKFAAGTLLPVSYRSEARLLKHLNAHPDSISYVPDHVAAQWPAMRVVARL